MNSPVKSAQLFHSLPRFPASTWQRKAKLVSVFNCVTLWECLTAYVKQNIWMEFNQIDHSPGTFVFFPLFHSRFHQIGCLLRKGGQTTTRRNSSRWSGASWAIFWGSRFRGTDSDHIPWRKRQDSRDFQQRSGHRLYQHKLLPPDSWRLTAWLPTSAAEFKPTKERDFCFWELGSRESFNCFGQEGGQWLAREATWRDYPHNVFMTRCRMFANTSWIR